ncbi:MAG: hypothetical protein RL130_506, partial [Actinomycetota bacterium]
MQGADLFFKHALEGSLDLLC